MLIIFAGLPGSGKTTIAKELAMRLGAVYLRIDTIEQALREGGLQAEQIGGLGYLIASRTACENLRTDRMVVVDSVNPWQLTRDMYRDAAKVAGVEYVEIEVHCSNEVLHRSRVEGRISDIARHIQPSWDEVLNRDYHAWDNQPLRIDSSETTTSEAVRMLIQLIESHSRSSR